MKGRVDGFQRTSHNKKMLRILLVLDDYSEMVFLQALLKKMGFDVDGAQSHSQFEEKLLGLNPEVVIATGSGKKVKGLQLISKIKGLKSPPSLVLLTPQPTAPEGVELGKQNLVKAVLQSPIQVTELIHCLARLGELDAQQLLAKYQRLSQTSGREGQLGREERMSNFLHRAQNSRENLPPHVSQGEELTRVKRKILESESSAEDKEQDQRRREFAAALYRKPR